MPTNAPTADRQMSQSTRYAVVTRNRVGMTQERHSVCGLKPVLLLGALLGALWSVLWGTNAGADERDAAVTAALMRAGENRVQLQQALKVAPATHREGMRFLIANMPTTDLESLSAEFLLEHVEYAYRAWRRAPWHDQVPKEIFLNNILPYCSIDERRDAWRKDFFERFQPLIANTNDRAETPGQAAAMLNRKIFPLLDVKYSRRRPKANQSPYESMEAHVASCSGLSVLLIDACRAVGVPARFVGTPLWTDRSGNHSWVEIWDNGWHFTGAAEPGAGNLDQAWFIGRAAQALRDQPLHSIYATSFRKTPLSFPLVWDRRSRYVYAVNVTDRYTQQVRSLPPGRAEVMLRVLDKPGGDRVAAHFRITDADGKLVREGNTNDERFDGNDHIKAVLRLGTTYHVTVMHDGVELARTMDITQDGQLFTFELGNR